VDSKLTDYGNIKHKVEGDHESPSYPRNYILMANNIARECWNLIYKCNPDFIIIEETNKGKNRYWQKQLEFIHYAVNAIIQNNQIGNNVRYIDTSEWRKLLGLHLDKEDRQHNNEVKRQRSEVRKQFETLYDQDHSQEYSLACAHPKKLARNRAIKEYLTSLS
jgi:hypothetical protein